MKRVLLLTAVALLSTGCGLKRVPLKVLDQLPYEAKIELLEPPVFFQRRTAGTFDVSAESVTQDPSPAGLVQTWTCKGGTNVSGFCDPQADSLVAAARFDRSAKPTIWRKALRRIDELAPAAFLASPSSVLSIHRRVTSPVITPWSLWSAVWQWKVGR